MNTTTSATRYYPADVPPLELPASQTRFPTLQPAGAFLKQMQSPYGAGAVQQQQQQQQFKTVGAQASSPTSPSSVAVASSFLASIRHGLEDLVDDDDDDEEDSDSDEDNDDESPRYYSASTSNTYYSPPASLSAQYSSAAPMFPSASSQPSPLLQPAASRHPRTADDELIFDMEM